MRRSANQGFTLKRSANHGFTMIEMLITIGMMAAISAVGYSVIGQGPRQSARDARRKADVQNIASALELYRNDRGYYPLAAGCANASCLAPTYMTTVPTPPTPPAGGTYTYASNGSCGVGACTYTLSASLEKTTDPNYPTYSVTNP